MDFEARLYHYGLGAGIPYGVLNSLANTVDVARNAPDLVRRRRLAREMLAASPWRGFIPPDRGFALVGPNTLPGTQEVLEAVRAIIADRRQTGWRARRHNPFYQLERAEDFSDYPALLDFALSDAMLHIVSDYYGMVPQMKEIGIWLTPPQDHEFSSQLYHLDKPESQLVKLFINVDPNDEDTGPLTLLPTNVSNVVRSKTRYESIYFRGDGRLTDKDVFAHCAPGDQIALGGESGSGGFADTSNCFHYGSRCRSGERKMLTVAFMLPYKAREVRTPLFDLAPEPADEVRRLVLSGAHFGRTGNGA
ncbi:MAG: hypothetical protein P8Y71_01920 [Pseudolabrys sp.]|jgi:hypothetical protein